MKIHVIVPEVRDSLENAVCLDLMISCLTQQMIQDTYPADLAQLQYSVNSGITREMGKEGRHCIIIIEIITVLLNMMLVQRFFAQKNANLQIQFFLHITLNQK